MSSAELLSPAVDSAVRRFAVAWRNRPRRLIAPVAVLDHDAAGYRFQYLPTVRTDVEGFRPFIGFPDLERIYESPRLWPFFDLRVMDVKRPDYADYVRQLGLPPDASRLDVLSRSGGEQKGDSVLLVEEPAVTDAGQTSSIFLARGLRYAGPEADTAAAADRLQAGRDLLMVDDIGNTANAKALKLLTQDGVPVGWVPDLLVDYARKVRDTGGNASVVQNNGPAAPWHMRLLVRITGRVAVGAGVFTGAPWPSVQR
jgi:hypothetical protein